MVVFIADEHFSHTSKAHKMIKLTQAHTHTHTHTQTQARKICAVMSLQMVPDVICEECLTEEVITNFFNLIDKSNQNRHRA